MTTERLPGRYRAETIALFTTQQHEHGYDKRGGSDAFLRSLLTAETPAPTYHVEDFLALLDLRQEEYADILAMIGTTGVEMVGLLRHLLLAELTRFKRGQVRLDNIDFADPDARSRRKDASALHLRHILDMWIGENEQAQDDSQRRYITNKGMEERSGCMPQLIKTFMRDHAERVHRHHQAMGWFTDEDGLRHNRKVGAAMRVQGMAARKAARAEARMLEDAYEVQGQLGGVNGLHTGSAVENVAENPENT
jgi:hypothetical protein